VAGDATRLGVVDVEGNLRTDLCISTRVQDELRVLSRLRQRGKRTSLLDVEEVHVVGGRVNHSPESHRVRDLSVEPDVLVRGEGPRQFGTDDADDIAQHRQEDEAAVKRKDEARTARAPHGPFETVQACQLLVRCL
jgi:hypothetical protein